MTMVDSSKLNLPAELISDLKIAKLRDRPVFWRQVETAPGSCPTCGGEGHLWLQFAESGPYQTPTADKTATFAWSEGLWWQVQSRFYPCPECLGTERRIQALFEDSGLELDERGWSLDYIRGLTGKEEAVRMGEDLLAQIPKPAGWLAIFGGYGVGKSGVLRSVVAGCCRGLTPARYVRAEDILRELRTTFADDAEVTEDEMVQRYGRYQVLAIDEVDRVSDTKWSRSALFTLLDTRYKRRSTLATLLATNCDPSSLPEGFEYLQSRMKHGERVEMVGKDLRE